MAGLADSELDVLIIGGGINGAVSASALAAQGLRVGLIDSRDFAGFTSQHSSNLIWGGIKYLENYDIGLVNDLCLSRNELLRAFPSTVREIRFLTTVSSHFRHPRLLMLAGAWLYWLLGRAKTAKPRLLSKRLIKRCEPLINTDDCSGGFEYSDAMLHDNDARFVFNFIQAALDSGWLAVNYLQANRMTRKQGLWHVEATDQTSIKRLTIHSKVLINASGAFVDHVNELCNIPTRHRHLFSKGIHLIVPRIAHEDRVLAFFADDGRLFFAIPMANRTCIGTTDTPVDNPVTAVSEADRQFILDNINRHLDLTSPLTADDIISERCGVRPLAVDQQASAGEDFLSLSRHHQIEIEKQHNHVSIFGGKLTDCINVGNEIISALKTLGIALPEHEENWYGEPSQALKTEFYQRAHHLRLHQSFAADTGEALSERLWRRYGRHAIDMLDSIELDPSQAQPIIEGSGIRFCEMRYLAEQEMIVKLEDFLRRRSKIALLESREKLKASAGLQQLCEQLFGDQAAKQYDEYFGDDWEAQHE